MSGKRSEILANDQVYHCLNRSVASEEIFRSPKVNNRMLELLEYYRFPQKLSFSNFLKLQLDLRKDYQENYKKKDSLVEIYAYVLMPNHFHLLIKQLKTDGIKKYLSNIQNGFAKYYNKKFERNGSLFQKPFKAKRIASDEIFLHISRYIHLNPVTSYLIEFDELENYQWSSFSCYVNRKENGIVNIDPIIKLIGSNNKYIKFVKNQANYQRKLNDIKQLVLEKNNQK